MLSTRGLFRPIDLARWQYHFEGGSKEASKPSQFFHNSNSIFYVDNQDIANYECEFIIKSQLEDGSWNIPWGWKGYSDEWAISKNWWKGNGAISNMLYLKEMGRLT